MKNNSMILLFTILVPGVFKNTCLDSGMRRDSASFIELRVIVISHMNSYFSRNKCIKAAYLCN